MGARGVNELDRAAVVDRPLPRRSAARARAGGEDDRVRPRDRVVDLDVLDVEHDRLGADLLEVRGLLGLADDPPRAVAALGEDLLEPQRDLPVATDDDDVHGRDHT